VSVTLAHIVPVHRNLVANGNLLGVDWRMNSFGRRVTHPEIATVPGEEPGGDDHCVPFPSGNGSPSDAASVEDVECLIDHAGTQQTTHG
jgi:hypothetical protein